MDKVILDSDIFSEVLKRKDPAVLARCETYLAEHDRLTVSAMTVMEVVRGLYRLGSKKQLDAFLAALVDAEVLEIRTEISILAGRIDADLMDRGKIIGIADVFIAATAILNELTLVTGNTDHYERIIALGYGLRIENWRQKSST